VSFCWLSHCSVFTECHFELNFEKYHFDECHYAECHDDECHSAECHSNECHSDESDAIPLSVIQESPNLLCVILLSVI
jgi:hypothetical protein